jgi:peptidoglycan hydrolase-like protein with peptidoglycan-binding domain
MPAPTQVLERPIRDLGADELWRRSLERSRTRRARAATGEPTPRSLVSEQILDLDAPAEFQLDIRSDRDLTDEDVWDLSLALARAKRRAAEKGLLPQARVASASLVVAAVAALAPTHGGAHSRGSAGAATTQVDAKLLKLGSRGSAVAAVQRALGITADGVFGPKTRKAVRAFQARKGLVADGIVGAQTRAALFGGSGAGAQNGAQKLVRAWWVAPVQRALGVRADGVYGPQTRAAVRAYQAKHGLTVDGVVGPQTLASLGITKGARGGRADGPKLIRAWWVAPVQRALGLPVDGVYGPRTRAAVRAYQAKHGLTVDGVVGPQTLAHLGISGGAGASEARNSGSGPASISRSLWDELALANRMGLRLVSGHRPGAAIGGGGNPSDHSYYPSRAIDVRGTPGEMRRYALAVAGRAGIRYVIYSPLGIWGNWNGSWRPVDGGTRASHYDHVHVSGTG